MLQNLESPVSQPQRGRLSFIELRLRFIGEIRDKIWPPVLASNQLQQRDLALYKELAPDNIIYDSKSKAYITGSTFHPAFEFPPERVLSWLSQGFGDGQPGRLESWIASDVPARTTLPDLNTLACITRAM
jgi:hypothetical protein